MRGGVAVRMSVEVNKRTGDGSASPSFASILPLELLDESIGKTTVIIMKDHRQFQGTLMGFDDFVSISLVYLPFTFYLLYYYNL